MQSIADNSTKIISIEGNIGSGKTTLLAHLQQYFNHNPNVIFLKEPVDDWESIKDNNGCTMLEKFYADQEKYSFPFQMMAYISRLSLLKTTIKENPNAIIISERSLYTDKFVFAKMLYDTDKIESVNYQIYSRWFDTFAQDYPLHKVIYVKADPEICNTRIIKRSRNGEDGIPIEYLRQCHEYHENMMNQLFTEDDKKIHILNGNQDIYKNGNKNDDLLQIWINQISEFLELK